jgi:hypothetical protein
MQGRYWTPHTVVVLAVSMAIVTFTVIMYAALSPSQLKATGNASQSKKSD